MNIKRKPSSQDIQQLMMKDSFKSQTSIKQLADPLVDTYVEITLDQLRTYEHNPRKSINPLYGQIKESIKTRGLDQPPTVTKRPNEKHYIIRNGGNTRLKALKELYEETGDEKFFRIKCLFKPWSGEIATLVGHLVENELHGELMFIDKAVAISNMRDFYYKAYPKESGRLLSLREVADYLKRDGYPVSYSLVGKMFDCVDSLLPAIPDLLYGGIGRPRIEDLLSLKNSLKKIWKKYIELISPSDEEEDDMFLGYWTTSLAKFNDIDIADFNMVRIKDELLEDLTLYTGQTYTTHDLDYLEMNKSDKTKASEATNSKLTSAQESNVIVDDVLDKTTTPQIDRSSDEYEAVSILSVTEDIEHKKSVVDKTEQLGSSPLAKVTHTETIVNPHQENEQPIDSNRHIIEPVSTSEKVQQINREIDKQLGGDPIEFATASTTAIPVQAGGGLSEVSDIWYIPQQIDSIDELRAELYLLACDLAAYGNYQAKIIQTKEGLGFTINNHITITKNKHSDATALLLMTILRLHPEQAQADISLALFNQLLMGGFEINIGSQIPTAIGVERLPDVLLVKLFRFIRLARRLVDLINKDKL